MGSGVRVITLVRRITQTHPDELASQVHQLELMVTDRLARLEARVGTLEKGEGKPSLAEAQAYREALSAVPPGVTTQITTLRTLAGALGGALLTIFAGLVTGRLK